MNDGYTLYARVGKHEFQYRPILKADRDSLLLTFKDMSASYAEKSTREMIDQQVVTSLDPNMAFHCDEDTLERLLNVVTLIAAPDEGEWSPTWEMDQAGNLRKGVATEVKYPHLAAQSCTYCLKYWYDPIDNTIAKRGGKPVLRPADAPPLCKAGVCPKGSPEKNNTLSPRNRLAYRSYLQDKATGLANHDPIARKNAVIIEKALRDNTQHS